MSQNKHSIPKDLEKKYEKFSRTKFGKKFTAEILSEVICSFGLGEEFLKDKKKALKEAQMIINKTPGIIDDNLVITLSLKKDINEIRRLIRLDSSDIFYKSLFLNTFSLLEGVINTFLLTELERAKKINFDRAYEFVRYLEFKYKLGIFLELLTDKRLDKGKDWSRILFFKKKRDFFIHLKPEKDKNLEKIGKISKKEIEELLEIILNLNQNLRKIHSQEIKNQNKIKKEVKKIMMK